MKFDIKHVCGNTFYFSFPGISIPFYKLREDEIILLDSGFPDQGQEINNYVISHRINVRAIIHSHIHPDHIAGDQVITQSSASRPELYGQMPELELMLKEQYERYAGQGPDREDSEKTDNQEPDREGTGKTDDQRPDREDSEKTDRQESYGEGTGNHSEPRFDNDPFHFVYNMEYLRDRMKDISSCSRVEIDGYHFDLIDAFGHSPGQQLIVTPDKVCYIGDALLYGKTLAKARCPYSYDLFRDIKAKRELSTLSYHSYISAHEGDFLKNELQSVIDKNILIYRNILTQAGRLMKEEPELEKTEAQKKLLEKIGINRPESIGWLGYTLGQYFDYYKTDLRKPCGWLYPCQMQPPSLKAR